MTTERSTFAIPWGMWHMSRSLICWTPNPNLQISADEQYRQNVANGFDCSTRRLRPVVGYVYD